MTDFITYREVREYTVRLPRNDYEAEHSYGEEPEDVKVISKEEIGRHHEPDYTLDCDLKAECYRLLKDGEQVFEHRSHDAVLEHAASLGQATAHMSRFGDLDDPDLSWRRMAEHKAWAAERKAAESGS